MTEPLPFEATCPDDTFITGGIIESIRLPDRIPYIYNLKSITCGKGDGTPETKVDVKSQGSDNLTPLAIKIETKLPYCKNGYKILNSRTSQAVVGLELTCVGDNFNQPGIGVPQFFIKGNNIQTQENWLSCKEKPLKTLRGKYNEFLLSPNDDYNSWIEVDTSELNCSGSVPPPPVPPPPVPTSNIETNNNFILIIPILILLMIIFLT